MPSIKSKTFLKIFLLGLFAVFFALLQRVNFEIYSVKPNIVLSFLASLIVSSLNIYQIWILAFLAVILSANGAYQGIFAASLLISFISISWLARKYLKRNSIGVIFTVGLATILFFILSFLLLTLEGQNPALAIFLNVFPKEMIYNILLSLFLAFIIKKSFYH